MTKHPQFDDDCQDFGLFGGRCLLVNMIGWKMFVGQYDWLEDVVTRLHQCPLLATLKASPHPASSASSATSLTSSLVSSTMEQTQKSFLRWVWQDFFFFIHQSFWEFEITADVQNSIANQFSLQKDFSLETCFPRLCTIKRIKRAYCRAPEIETKYNLWALKIILYLLHVWL